MTCKEIRSSYYGTASVHGAVGSIAIGLIDGSKRNNRFRRSGNTAGCLWSRRAVCVRRTLTVEDGSGIRITIIDMTAVMGCGIVAVWLSISRTVCLTAINAVRHGAAIGQEP